MADLMDFEPVTGDLRAEVGKWLFEHEDQYAKVWDRLDQMRRHWATLSHKERVALVKGSYIFTLYTQRTDTPVAEEAFDRLLDGETIRESRIHSGAFKQNQMAAWIYDSFADMETWDSAVHFIECGHVDAAHEFLMDEVTGLSTIKAGFLLANLGLTQKMCVDSNVAALLGTESPSDVDVETYSEFCGRIEDFFPEISKKLDPYHTQWLLFDFQRWHKLGSGKGVQDAPKVATHDEWFRIALNQHHVLVDRMDQLDVDAKVAQMELEAADVNTSSLAGVLNTGKENLIPILDKVDGGVGADQDPNGGEEAIRADIREAVEGDTMDAEIDEAIREARGD